MILSSYTNSLGNKGGEPVAKIPIDYLRLLLRKVNRLKLIGP